MSAAETETAKNRPQKVEHCRKMKQKNEFCGVLQSKISRKILLKARQQNVDVTDKINPEFPANLVEWNHDSKSTIWNETVDEQQLRDELQMDVEDDKALATFGNRSQQKMKNLSDIINNKIAEKQNDLNTKLTNNDALSIDDVDPKIREMYENVRDIMKKYRSGKVPKAFKVIPKLKNWEQILFITEPHNWSAAAMYQGTRIFASVLSQGMAQKFFNLVLLPRIRDDLCEFKRLNIHLYNALRKALCKPAAFMKGIILPLLENGNCTLREAIIFGSIIAKCTIPVLHSSACLLKICEMEYSGANSIFIQIFLNKRYALPYRVIDAAVFHFLRFSQHSQPMPTLWHQSLLTFVQRYKDDISSEQKELLFGLLRAHTHPKFTPEIRRELQAAVCRDGDTMDYT